MMKRKEVGKVAYEDVPADGHKFIDVHFFGPRATWPLCFVSFEAPLQPM
jgi:hypothetical protein